MVSDIDIIKELRTINDYSKSLSPRLIYVGGIARNNTSLAPTVIFKFLKRLNDLDSSSNSISNDMKEQIEVMLYKGKIGEANQLLNSILEAKISTILPEIKMPFPVKIPDPFVPVPPQITPDLKFQAKCGICDSPLRLNDTSNMLSCPHKFH